MKTIHFSENTIRRNIVKKKSESEIGDKNPFYGKHHTEETKKKLSEANKGKGTKKVLQYTIEGEFVKEWPSIVEIQRELGVCGQNISSCCRGKVKTIKGFIWKYKH